MQALGPARQTLPDTLRALALLGVLVGNSAGYAVAPWGPLLGRLPLDGSGVAAWVMGLQAAVFHGKAYPVLAFLFGLSLVLAARRSGAAELAQAAAKRRLTLLLGLGVFHGVFIYFGDILTAYALTALTVLMALREPWPGLRRRLRRALVWAACAVGGVLLLTAWVASTFPVLDSRDEPGLADVSSWGAFFGLNFSAYSFGVSLALVMVLPLLRLCMLAGMAAARLRWLTHRRWAAQRVLWLKRIWLPALAANIGFAWALVAAQAQEGQAAWQLVEAGASLVGLPLAATWVLAVAVLWQRGHRSWAQHLAPLGQRSLSLYVGHSLLCVLFLSGLGLAWRPGGLGMLLWALGLWLAALTLAHAAPHRRWPLEAWMARR